MTAPIEVVVDLGERSYPVLIGSGAVSSLGDLLPNTASRGLVVTQPNVPAIVEVPIEHSVAYIGQGEQHKTLETVGGIASAAAQAGLTRNDVIIALGGGMVTDVAGFAAASYHRGIAVVHVATTLLAMVDAAVGGKTGVNLPEGKNLVGAFWQPSSVICDLDALDSLPERERRCGYGEMAKYHFLTGDDLLSLPLPERIARCVQIKADIVAADEREGGQRALLNYGHTLAHALETATGHRLAHGEAVAIGVLFAAELASVLDRIDDRRVEDHYRIVGDYQLDVQLPDAVDDETLLRLMQRDKKAVNGLTFVLDSADGAAVVDDVPIEAVTAALATFRQRLAADVATRSTP